MLDDKGGTSKWKDYRIEGPERYKVMTLDTHEFIRRFLMHVLPQGFHRIRYYGLLTSQTRAKNIARARELLAVPLIPIDAIKATNAKASTSAQPEEPTPPDHPCPCCGGRMIIIETFLRGCQPRPPHAGSTSNQDRYLMIPPPSIRHRTAPLHSGSLSAGSAPACIVAPDRPAAPPQIRSGNAQVARSKSNPQTFFDLAITRTAAIKSHWHPRPPKSP